MNTLTLKDLEDIQEYEAELSNEHSWGVVDRGQLRSLLSLARRQLEQEEGKPGGRSDSSGACAPPADSDVAPLGEGAFRDLFCKDASGQAFWMEASPPDGVRISDVVLRREQVRSLIAHLQSWLDTGSFELKPASPVTDQPLGEKVNPGDGWRLLKEGEPLQEGDGFLDPSCRTEMWIDYACRPDIFRGSKATGCPVKDYAHTWPWRRRVDVS